MKKAYLFIDAENHFIRSNKVADSILNEKNALEAIYRSGQNKNVQNISGFPLDIDGKRFGWDRELNLFWDCWELSQSGKLSHLEAKVDRAIYVCPCTGDEDKAFNMKAKLRNYQFEPVVIIEDKDRKKNRSRSLEENSLIEKAKGCDITLATRMVDDAAANLYDCCFLFTSDADFLPAIEAVRRMGKTVWVFGYQTNLPRNSPYLYIPDRFIDLTNSLNTIMKRHKDEILEIAKSLKNRN